MDMVVDPPLDSARLLSIERDLAVLLAETRELDAALSAILDAALRLGGLDGGGVYLFQEDGGLTLAVHRGLGAAFVAETGHIDPNDPRIDVVRRGVPMFAPYEAIVVSTMSEVQRAEGLHALAVIPVRSGDETVAVLNVASHTVDEIAPPVRDALVSIASRIGNVVQRVRVEAAVRASQGDFQALFDGLRDFLFVFDDHGAMVHVNSVVTDRLGYTREELLGQSVLFVHPEPRRAEALQIVGEMLAGASTFCPIPLVTKDGRHVPVETVVSRGRWNGRPAILGISRDVTRRATAEAALQQAERTQRTIVDHAPVGIARLDVHGRFLQTNPALEAMLGYSGVDLAELDFAQVTHPEDVAASVALFRGLVRGERDTFSLQKRYLRRSGSFVWLEVSFCAVRGSGAQPDFVVLLANDITTRRNLEAAQAESERQFRQMADAAPVLIWVCDTEGQRSFFNRTWYAFTGRTSVQELGHGWLEGVHPDDAFAVRASTARALADRVPLAREYRLRHAGTPWRWVLERANPRFDASGHFAGFIGSCIDITDRKRIETEREELVDQLQHALTDVKTLRGLVPICAWCRKVRNDQGYWGVIEEFLRDHSEAEISHGVCPDCMEKHFPEEAAVMRSEKDEPR
jgi:PAS domain S-box-containing protein